MDPRTHGGVLVPNSGYTWAAPPPPPRDVLEGQGPRRQPHQRLDGRLEEVAKAVGGGYCRLQMPLRLALGVRGTVAGRRPGALKGGGGVPPPLPVHPCPPPPPREAMGDGTGPRRILLLR